MKLHVKAEFELSHKNYGSPWIKLELDIPISKNVAAWLMREAGIKARKPRKFKVTTDSSHKLDRAPNLVNRQISELGSSPDCLWVSDLSYLWTQHGWLYLCFFIDVYSRKVVGYSSDDTMETAMVNDARNMAFRRRPVRDNLIIHSDH